jgi:hypothetical protein
MVSKSVRYPFIYFLILTGWQGIIDGQIKWMENAVISFLLFLVFIFLNWANKPYKWKKDNVG